ncbi:preprotein translocase subunit SecE [Patescibacteria group bacterium]|nr:preprotein translocase subunit SecE [Patescibacteria group bacterium]
MRRLLRFIREAYLELKSVKWPSKRQTIRLTLYVLGVSLGVALFVWAVDLVFKEILSTVVLG